MTEAKPESLIDRFRSLANDDPDHVAVTTPNEAVTRRELESRSDAIAKELLSHGTQPGDFVSIVLPNGADFIASAIAAWKVGAVVNPLNTKLAETELAGLIDLVNPRVAIVDDPANAHGQPFVLAHANFDSRTDVSLDATVVSPMWKAIGSGGSTGRPKVIVSPVPALAALHDESRIR
ncbi:AMP-binding protein, partial [Microbacterium sp. A93]|uniref:AMP-binding protein n=1 Tax=Microbacterium sp. A93 TaxID=3450716 RepID=UPI003F441484